MEETKASPMGARMACNLRYNRDLDHARDRAEALATALRDLTPEHEAATAWHALARSLERTADLALGLGLGLDTDSVSRRQERPNYGIAAAREISGTPSPADRWAEIERDLRKAVSLLRACRSTAEQGLADAEREEDEPTGGHDFATAHRCVSMGGTARRPGFDGVALTPEDVTATDWEVTA